MMSYWIYDRDLEVKSISCSFILSCCLVSSTLMCLIFLHLIQDYIKESDNLVLLHEQIRDCDIILSQMETLLTGFQVFLCLCDVFWYFRASYEQAFIF